MKQDAFPVVDMRKVYGDERKYDKTKPETNPSFFYQLHHQLPNAAQDYAKDTRATLYAMGFGDGRSGAAPPRITSKKLFVDDAHPAMWERTPQPTKLQTWISQEEFDYYVKDFERHGWNGGLCWYRVMDIDVHATPQLLRALPTQPCQFITGTHDIVVAMLGRDEKGEFSIERGLERLPTVLSACGVDPADTTIIEGAGHWIQQEKPEEVNADLLKFVDKHRTRFADGASRTSRL